MEFYIPDKEFEKSDFKGVPFKKGEGSRDSTQPHKSESPQPKTQPERLPTSKPTRKPPLSPPVKNTPLPKEPATVEYKIRNANDLAQNKKTRMQAGNELTVKKKDKPPTPVRKSLTPRQARSVEMKNAHAPAGWKPQQMTRAQAQNAIPNKQPKQKKQSQTSHPAVPAGRSLIAQAVLSNLQGARHILRNWLYEKKGMSTTKIAYIEPHDRIYLALRLIGMDVLPTFFSTMTPKEREQFVNILKSARNIPDGFVAAVQTEFIDQVMNQGLY